METPNDDSPWRCPECGELMKNCTCDDDAVDDAEWQDRFIEGGYEP